MAIIRDSEQYEVINPQTGIQETWSGERIRIYLQTYDVEVLPIEVLQTVEVVETVTKPKKRAKTKKINQDG